MREFNDCLSDDDKKTFKELKKAYRKLGIGLFTGLGVSYDSGMPGWDTITQRVMSKIKGGEKKYLELRAMGFSLPTILTWAHEKLGDTFTESLRQTLYQDLDLPLWIDGIGENFQKEVRAKNPTLAAVGAFTAHFDGQKYSPNPRVKAILTTNVDTLLRQYTYRAFETHILRSVERASASPTPGRTNLYYLHGMIRYDHKRTRTKEAADKLIFTDLQYHAVYRELSSIFTYTPLFLFREYPFLFIGTSMTDDNVRRLLYWSIAEINRAEDEEGKPSKGGKRLHYALLKAPKEDGARTLMSDLLRPVRVSPIWYGDHADVPLLLRELYADEEGWARLYQPDPQ